MMLPPPPVFDECTKAISVRLFELLMIVNLFSDVDDKSVQGKSAAEEKFPTTTSPM